ncbi:hypothetical protein RJ640_029959 [Escallonia rubra]|uniref:Uncharacterized protein n=1 Tax=Escallonia rubra TaxID=112253 RepID=A0AA88UEG0_9ASTE|nr:hypothetical protein RJ640_029959 [Escallonia rubra]
MALKYGQNNGKLLNCMESRVCSCEDLERSQLPRALGISPVNLFPEMDNAPRFFKLPTSDGSGPVNSFRSKKRPIEREEIPITCSGIMPVRRLLFKSSPCRFVQLPNSAGILPSSMFFAAPTKLSPSRRFLRFVGIGPAKSFPDMSKIKSLEALAIEGGNEPKNLLAPR